MARFRPSPDAEALLASITGIEPDDLEHPDPAAGVADWLTHQHLGRITLAQPAPLVDIHDPTLLRDLDKHPLVRAALQASGLGSTADPRPPGRSRRPTSGGPVGRPITQALSRALREWHPRPRRPGLPPSASTTKNGAGPSGTPPPSTSPSNRSPRPADTTAAPSNTPQPH